ncbi:AfsR/SARP family transcriptional regulator [Arthrobacter sp. MDT1-65]
MTIQLATQSDTTSAWQRGEPMAQQVPEGRLVTLLGDFEMSADSGPVRVPANVERLVAYLAITATPQPRAKVACTLSMDVPEPRAGARLRAALWQVEKTAPGWVCRDGCRLYLAPEVVVDLPLAFAHARRIANEAQGLAVDDVGIDDLMFDLLPHWDEEWLIFERERMRQLRAHALETLCVLLAKRGQLAQAIDAGITAVAIEPLRESAHRALITAHLTEGNVSEARREFFSYRDLLEERLGIAPTCTLRDLVLSSRQH